MEALEQMVDMTAKLFECDRDEMYSYILRICSKALSDFHLSVCLYYYLISVSLCVYVNSWPPTLAPFALLSWPPTSGYVSVQCSCPSACVCVFVCVWREVDGEWHQSEVSRRHGVIAAVESRADNSCDWSVKADCQPITLSTHFPTHIHTHH